MRLATQTWKVLQPLPLEFEIGPDQGIVAVPNGLWLQIGEVAIKIKLNSLRGLNNSAGINAAIHFHISEQHITQRAGVWKIFGILRQQPTHLRIAQRALASGSPNWRWMCVQSVAYKVPSNRSSVLAAVVGS